MPKAIPQSKLNAVLHGLDSGHSYSRITSDVKVSQGTISNIRILHRPDLKMSVGGRPRKLSPTAVRYALRLVTRRSSNTSISKAVQQFCKLTRVSIHPQTVHRALRAAGLKPTKKAKSPTKAQNKPAKRK